MLRSKSSSLNVSESNKVSYSECQMSAFDRLDCGYYGISTEQCASRDCCWEESVIPGVPWCFHTISKFDHIIFVFFSICHILLF